MGPTVQRGATVWRATKELGAETARSRVARGREGHCSGQATQDHKARDTGAGRQEREGRGGAEPDESRHGSELRQVDPLILGNQRHNCAHLHFFKKPH